VAQGSNGLRAEVASFGGAYYQGLGGSRARSAWACSHESSVCARSRAEHFWINAAAAAAAKALAAPERARRGLVLAGEVPAREAAARVWKLTHRRRHWPPRHLQLPSALGLGLFSRENRLRSQQRRACWAPRGGGTGHQGLGCSRAR